MHAQETRFANRAHKLTRRGYTVKKAALTADVIAGVREDLFIRQIRDKMLAERKRWDRTPDPSDDGKVYKENAAKLYLPPCRSAVRCAGGQRTQGRASD